MDDAACCSGGGSGLPRISDSICDYVLVNNACSYRQAFTLIDKKS